MLASVQTQETEDHRTDRRKLQNRLAQRRFRGWCFFVHIWTVAHSVKSLLNEYTVSLILNVAQRRRLKSSNGERFLLAAPRTAGRVALAIYLPNSCPGSRNYARLPAYLFRQLYKRHHLKDFYLCLQLASAA